MPSRGADAEQGLRYLDASFENRQQMSLLHYQIPEYGLTVGFYPHHFTQVNALMNRELVRTVMGYLGNQRGRVVVDMFCGTAITLPLARTGALAGIEASDEAVEMAREMPG